MDYSEYVAQLQGQITALDNNIASCSVIQRNAVAQAQAAADKIAELSDLRAQMQSVLTLVLGI